jgi:glycosyltransferase involved in cell wall biosynthesis
MTFPVRVLELRSVRGTGGGPEKTILNGACLANPREVAVTVCYIRDARDRVFNIDVRAARLGIDYVEVLERHSFDPGIWPALVDLVRSRAIDIVHSHEHKTDLLALLLARRCGVRALATAHGWSGLSLRERLYYAVDRRILTRFPRVIAVSENIRGQLMRRGAAPERVRRTLNGIDASMYRPDASVRQRARARLLLSPSAVVIGAVGRLEPIKRYDVLIDAVARLRLPRPPVLMLVGEGSCRDQLRRHAADAGLPDVRFVGHVDDPRPTYQAFDVFAQSSDSEGVPNAVLEAMALHVPVVATDVGGTNELITSGVHGVLVPPRDPATLAGAIESTVLHRHATGDRVIRARARVETELSFAARTEALHALYRELMEAPAREVHAQAQCA